MVVLQSCMLPVLKCGKALRNDILKGYSLLLLYLTCVFTFGLNIFIHTFISRSMLVFR